MRRLLSVCASGTKPFGISCGNDQITAKFSGKQYAYLFFHSGRICAIGGHSARSLFVRATLQVVQR